MVKFKALVIALYTCIVIIYTPKVEALDNSSTSTIKKVLIEGNVRIPQETIESYMELSTPFLYSDNLGDIIIQKLFATGFFANILLKNKGNTLFVIVNENPIINQITLEGNHSIRDDTLKSGLVLRSNSMYSLAKASSDLNALVNAYKRQGFFSAKIEPQLIKLPHNRVDMVYRIDEGKKAKIKRIIFIGNNVFTTKKLHEIIMSKEYAFYRFFSSAPNYDPDKVLFDQELLKAHYLEAGYANFRIVSVTSELTPAQDECVLTFVLEEGIKYQYGDIMLTTKIKGLNTSEILPIILPKTSKTFNIKELDATVDKIIEYLGINGYAFTDVGYSITKNDKDMTASVHFFIKEGQKMYINKINIINNTRTLDKVIRRELRVAEGDPYNVTKIERSKQRLTNLGYFSYIDLQNKRTSAPDKLDVDIDVKEQPTGSMHFTIGYNTELGPIGGITISENNFLGKGQATELFYQQAKRSSDLGFSFTEPKFINKDIAAGFDVYYGYRNKSKESSYSAITYGLTMRAGYELTEHLYHGVRYNIKRDTVKDVTQNSSLIVQDQDGPWLTSSIGHTLTYNRLDNNIVPTGGYMLRFMQDLAGLGGNAKYLKHEAVADFYLPIPIYKQNIILHINGRAGVISGIAGQKVKLMENFYIGEEYIRGFETAGIGPRDKYSTDAVGGKHYYTGTAELNFPLGLPEEIGIMGAAFIDVGTLYGLDKSTKIVQHTIQDSKKLRASYGFGIIWRSPLGMIRIDYGIPFRKENFDKVQKFRLSLGGMF